MRNTLLLTALAVLLLPVTASAGTATVNADLEMRNGTRFGPITFKAAKGDMNGVIVTQANGRLRFHDRLQLIEAKGDCGQVNDNTVTCPVSEDIAKVELGNRADFADVEGLVEVSGGKGPDFLGGSSGFDDLNGGAGADVLRGGRTGDELTGGAGSDTLFGGPGDDDLIDGERDGNSAPDAFMGGSSRDTAGSDRGDMVLYTQRKRGITINLSSKRHGIGPGHDDITGIESVSGGSGDDRLRGDGDDNHLVGNGGDDVLRGRGGDDFASGGLGSDTLKGLSGDDVLNGDKGSDAFFGGSGDDDLVANDASTENLVCGTGQDIARSTRLDGLQACEVANSDPLYIGVQPNITGHTATFQVACQQLGGCDGELKMSGPGGEDFGSGNFADLPDDPETFSPVTVNLTDAAVEALADGVVVEVLHGEFGGYRAFMQSG
jgi:hypothetical protein